MLQSYEAIYDHGQIRWLGDRPPSEKSRVIVTLLPPQDQQPARFERFPSPRVAGKGRILGDIMAPAAPSDEWDALR
jgi:hypothetical protein